MVVRDVKKLLIAIGVFILVMMLNFPFPNAQVLPRAAGSMWVMNIIVSDGDGLVLKGLILLTILCVGIYLLATSLEKYRVRLVILALVLYGLTPPFLLNVYQNTFASGIYAIHYDSDASECRFEPLDAKTLDVQCDLSFENLSDDEVKFDVRFLEESFFEERFYLVPLLNEKGPYPATLQGHSKKPVRIQTTLDMSQVNGFSGGSTYDIRVEIVQDDNMRRF